MRTERTKDRSLAVALLGLLTLSFAAVSAADQTALGRDGELYGLRFLTSAEAFGTVAESTADDPVLAIELLRAGEDAELIVVPGTEGAELESSAHLAYEQRSGTVFVTWERRTNSIHSQILLASYSEGQWSDLIPVSDQRFSLKSSPRIAISRESFANPGTAEAVGGEPRSIQRTTLHVVWFEERGGGPAVVYAPIVLIDGTYVGAHSRLTLSELFSSDASGAPAPVASILPTIRPTRDQRSVAVGFVDPTSGDMVVSRISLLSGELTAISDEARAHIIDIGARYDSRRPAELRRMADEARAHIIDIGAHMDGPLVRFVADEARAHIIDIGARYDSRNQQDLERLAGESRAHIIDIGFRLDARGVPRTKESRAVLVDLRGGSGEILSVIRAEEVGPRSLPQLAAESADLHLSGSGENALIAWREGNNLRYRETTEAGWGEVRSLKIDGQLTIEKAEDVLRAHLDSR